jgi:hypothetical protein
MTARRYESGKLVSETPSSDPKFGWAKKDDEAIAEMRASSVPPSEASGAELPKDAETRPVATNVVRRPPPAVVAKPAPVVELPETPVQTLPVAPPPSKASVSVADERIEDTSDMRKFLLRQMVRAAKGEITTETVKNVVALSQQVYNATALELKAATILKDAERSIRALELVSPQIADQ